MSRIIDYDRMTMRKRVRAGAGLGQSVLRSVARSPSRPDQRLIFTVTNGRSGSDMLHRLFSAFDRLEARHEPAPDFRHFRPYVAANPALACSWLKHVKLPAIAELPGKIYVETSHIFCKGYLEPMLTLEQEFDLILLRRPAREIALSMSRLPAIPGAGPWAESFYVSPGEPNMLPLPENVTLTPYQTCYWHALENEVRQEHYGRLMRGRGARVAEIATGELSDEAALRRLFADLAIDCPLDEERFEAALGKRVNLKLHEKREVRIDMGRIEAEEAALQDLVARAAA